MEKEQIRYHQSVRPRLANPSFASSNVGASLGTFWSAYDSPIISGEVFGKKTEYKSMFRFGETEQLPSEGARLRQSKSLMSNYGTNSLESLSKHISEKEIYEKQEKKYNIITSQPKTHAETIKKYPKFRLEDLDQCYNRKLKLQEEYSSQWPTSSITRNQSFNPEQPVLKPLQRRTSLTQSFRPTILNNADEVGKVI